MAGDYGSVIRNIAPIIILAIVYLSHKVIRKTKIVKLEDVELNTTKEH